MPEIAVMYKYTFNDQDIWKRGIAVITIYPADMNFESDFYSKFHKSRGLILKRNMAYIYQYNIIVMHAR